jgi:hypothetical protein
MKNLPPALQGQKFEAKKSIFDVTPAVLKNVDKLGLDYLIAIGWGRYP